MDWIDHNKFQKGLIVFLLVLNLFTLYIIWERLPQPAEEAPKQKEYRAAESVALLQQLLNLDEQQTRQVEQILTVRQEQSKAYNERMSLLKKALAEEAFKVRPDTAVVSRKTREIGELQGAVERVRYQYVQDLLALCSAEQKERLMPVIVGLFGRKPPKDETADREPGRKETQKENMKEKPSRQQDKAKAERRDDGKREPPSQEEKVRKYSERLNLSADQEAQLLDVLRTVQKTKGREPQRGKDDPGAVEAEKERTREMEDRAVMNILTPEQKKEFERMLSNRKKNPR
jgi:hypothetical protein